jgi:hypothetical protein
MQRLHNTVVQNMLQEYDGQQTMDNGPTAPAALNVLTMAAALNVLTMAAALKVLTMLQR